MGYLGKPFRNNSMVIDFSHTIFFPIENPRLSILSCHMKDMGNFHLHSGLALVMLTFVMLVHDGFVLQLNPNQCSKWSGCRGDYAMLYVRSH